MGLTPSSEAGTADGGLDADPVHSEDCIKPKLHWQLLPRHGCTVKEMVCIDQVDQHEQAPDILVIWLGVSIHERWHLLMCRAGSLCLGMSALCQVQPLETVFSPKLKAAS